MFKQMAKFLRDERGYVPATEWMLVATILTLGTLAAVWTIERSEDRADDAPPALMCSGSIQE
jgi:hypothetical protein